MENICGMDVLQASQNLQDAEILTLCRAAHCKFSAPHRELENRSNICIATSAECVSYHSGCACLYFSGCVISARVKADIIPDDSRILFLGSQA